MRNSILAWSQYPEPTGTTYYAADLYAPGAVALLFARAAGFRAQITARGWQFLVEWYGLTGLLDINRPVGWFDPLDDHGAREQILHLARIAGYDIANGWFGAYVDRLVEDEPLAAAGR